MQAGTSSVRLCSYCASYTDALRCQDCGTLDEGVSISSTIMPCLKCGQLMRRTRWTFKDTDVIREGWRCKPCNVNLVHQRVGDVVDANANPDRDAHPDPESGGEVTQTGGDSAPVDADGV